MNRPLLNVKVFDNHKIGPVIAWTCCHMVIADGKANIAMISQWEDSLYIYANNPGKPQILINESGTVVLHV